MDEQKAWLGRGWSFPVRLDPRTGGIAVSEYENDIEESIRIILRTSRGERVMRPDFGCGIHDLVFDVVDQSTLTRVETSVRDAMTRFEARIELLDVIVNPRDAAEGRLIVSLDYRVRRTNQIGNLVFPFYFREGGVGNVERSRG